MKAITKNNILILITHHDPDDHVMMYRFYFFLSETDRQCANQFGPDRTSADNVTEL